MTPTVDPVKYGRTRQQPSLPSVISFSWTGSARDLITEDLKIQYTALEPRGCGLAALTTEGRVSIRSYPQVLALRGQMTDELNRRRIDGTQRNSIHTARDKLDRQFEDQKQALKHRATEYWDGHKFRAQGEIPSPSISKGDIDVTSDATENHFIRARVKYLLSQRPNFTEIEQTVQQIPTMYRYDEEDR